MANSTPLPSSLSLVPHNISQDPPFDGNDNHPLPIVPNTNFGNWMDADTDEVVALTRCDDGNLKACIVAASTSVWGVPEMFPAQLDADFCLLHPMKPNHLAVIEQTGAGKTHILQTLGVIKRGIVLIFIPLLMLLADVMSKFTCAAKRYGAVIIQHLDELFNTNKPAYHKLLQRCCGLHQSTSTTIFLFLALQFIINHPDACDVFIECSNLTTLCAIALDEAHIHVQHGTSFRGKIWALQVNFFLNIFGSQQPKLRPQLIALTVTMPISYLTLLANLLTISHFSGDSLLHGTQDDFSQQEIDMQSFILANKGQYVLKGLTLTANLLQENPSMSAVIFFNSRKQSQYFHDHLERKLNKMKLNVDVIHINVSFHKINKF
jgi:superfamily II DNA helicase RecQ